IVTLVEGRTFCLSSAAGDITPSLAQGLFIVDTRAIARWELRLNGAPVEGLSFDLKEPYSVDFAGRGRPAPGQSDADLVVFRRRRVGRGMYERVEVINHGTAPTEVTVELVCDADFADIFEVKSGRVHQRVNRRTERRGDTGLVFIWHDAGRTKEVRLSFTEPAIIEPGLVTWRCGLAPGERWEVCCEVAGAFGGEVLEPRFRCGTPEEDTVPSRRLESWRATLPDVASSCPELDVAVARSGQDLGSLRIFDADRPDVPILAAGAPWYMTLFGRDSILTAWMTLLADPSLALGVLDTLARFQGTAVDPRTDEEPGKILHEVRLDLAAGRTLSSGDIYYGSIDATPLF